MGRPENITPLAMAIEVVVVLAVVRVHVMVCEIGCGRAQGSLIMHTRKYCKSPFMLTPG